MALIRPDRARLTTAPGTLSGMLRPRLAAVAPLALGAMLLTACAGNAPERAVNPAPTIPTTTTLPPTTPAPATTASVAPATTSSVSSVSSTVDVPTVPSTTASAATQPAPGAGPLTLRVSGIGDVAFGSDAENAIAYVTGLIGPPTTDSGWLSAFDSPFGVCPGEQVRGVTWGDLLLLFGDETIGAAGQRHLFSYIYGPGATPAGLTTPEGIGIGSTVALLRSTYADTELYDDEFLGRGFRSRTAGVVGQLSDTTDAGTVLSLSGGVSCGE